MIRPPPRSTRTDTLFPYTTLFLSTLLAAGIALTVTAPGQAQDYPTQPVKVAVPYSAGGGTDVVTRALSQYLGEGLNQQFIVENRGGANASIGAEVVATSKPDGYTLLVVSGVPFVLNEAIYEDLAYDTQADFAPINVFAALPMVLVATALAVLQEGIRSEEHTSELQSL